ncbi:MAG: amidohydrolase [Saezia sp.]
MNTRVQEIRNHLHTFPEKPFEEFKTAAYLAETLRKAGFDVTENVGGTTCVIGTLKGKGAGPVLAVRGDMDALAHTVDGKECMIHSCGHDANCAMVAAMAEEVAKTGIARGTLKIVFQPAEEIASGALSVIKSGAIDDVDYMMGIHLRPIQEVGLGQAIAALKHGSSGTFDLVITGKTAHGARPHLGINAIDAAVCIINAVNTIKENPGGAWSIKPTHIHADNKLSNAIPEKVTLTFDVRAQSNTIMNNLVEKLAQIIKTAPQSIGATAEIVRTSVIPGADLDDEMTDMLAAVITETIGEKALVREFSTTGGDDFHCYKVAKPSIKAGFIGLGADLSPGLHTVNMSFNEDALPTGVQLLIGGVKKLLG